MHIPDNEGKACGAVVRLLEKWTGETHTDIRHPEKDGDGPPVDLRLKLGTQEYAIEHTRIEPFKKQITTGVVFKEMNGCIKRRLSDPLPGSAYYELHVPTGGCLPAKKRGKRNQALNNLVEWIRTNAQCLHERNSGRSERGRSPYQSDDPIQGIPAGFNCTIELLRWPDAALIRRKPGDLGTRLICPPDLEDRRIERLKRAFSDKCPKLKHYKAERARTVLVLESLDIALTSFDLIGNQLPVLLAERTDAPDEIYLVETHTNPWWVWLMKRDDDHWPTVGMPQWGQTIYEPDKLLTQGMPKWYRDALGLDQLYVAHVPEWIPATFDEDELDDLTGRS